MDENKKTEKSKILLVDDKIENLISLETILEDFDLEFIRALSGNEALTLTLRHEFALALIDVRMPVMNGFETVQLLRQSKHTLYLPVIFVSAEYTDEYHKIKGVESGAVDFRKISHRRKWTRRGAIFCQAGVENALNGYANVADAIHRSE